MCWGRSSTDWTGDGTSISPYLINRASQLAGLSISVNNGTTYEGKYFKLGIDLKTHNVKCEYRRWESVYYEMKNKKR